MHYTWLRYCELFTHYYFIVHRTLYTVHCTMYIVYYTAYIVHCTLYNVHCIMYTLLYICHISPRQQNSKFRQYAIIITLILNANKVAGLIDKSTSNFGEQLSRATFQNNFVRAIVTSKVVDRYRRTTLQVQLCQATSQSNFIVQLYRVILMSNFMDQFR